MSHNKNLKNIIVVAIITILLIIPIYIIGSIIVHSGDFKVIHFELGIKEKSQSIQLEESGGTGELYPIVRDNIIIDSPAEKIVYIWLKDDIENIDLLLSSWGMQGGSTFLGDTTSLIDISINNNDYSDKTQNSPLIYTIKKKIEVQTFDIDMSFDNNFFLISKPQVYKKKVIIEWVSPEKFNLIKPQT